MRATDNESTKPIPRIVPLTMVPETSNFSWLTIATLRHWVFNSDYRYAASGQRIAGNGFNTCILRVGRRIYVDLDRLETWLLSHSSSVKEGVSA